MKCVNLGGKIFILMLLISGMIFSPIAGSMSEADETNATQGDSVTFVFWDCTGQKPVKQTIEFADSEWITLRDNLREIRMNSDSVEESFNAQFDMYKSYGLIQEDVTYEEIEQKAMERFEGKSHRPARQPLFDNVIINAMCAISFEIDNGNNLVLGLNTFVNLLGFDIISFHNGHTPDGIYTFGTLLEQTTEPGDYIGFMFGFFGYWGGTSTGTGRYSDLVVSGFSVTTTWLPKLN